MIQDIALLRPPGNTDWLVPLRLWTAHRVGKHAAAEANSPYWELRCYIMQGLRDGTLTLCIRLGSKLPMFLLRPHQYDKY